MAIDFSGASVAARNDDADLDAASSQVTVCCWLLADGSGGASIGTVIHITRLATTGRLVLARDGANRMRITKFSTGVTGLWRFPALDAVWQPVSFSFDFSSTANDPIARVDFAGATVTEVTAPTGTMTTPQGGYILGNSNAGNAAFDGAIAYMQVWNSILTGAQQDEALKYPGSIPGARLHIWGYDDGGLYDRSGFSHHPTSFLVTMAHRNGPPVTPFPLGEVLPLRSSFGVDPGGGGGSPIARIRGRILGKIFARA